MAQLNVAMENCHRNSEFFPLNKKVIFHGKNVAVYQRLIRCSSDFRVVCPSFSRPLRHLAPWRIGSPILEGAMGFSSEGITNIGIAVQHHLCCLTLVLPSHSSSIHIYIERERDLGKWLNFKLKMPWKSLVKQRHKPSMQKHCIRWYKRLITPIKWLIWGNNTIALRTLCVIKS